MKIKDAFEKSVHFFREKNIENPRLEAELLLASVLNTDRIGIYLKYEAPLSESETHSLRELVVRKGQGEPTAYLLQEKYFFGRKFKVGPGVLIPRPETEQIIEEVLSFINLKTLEKINIADLGAGSGCLGLTLGLEVPSAQVTLVEKSPQAFEYTKNNFNLWVDESHRSRFHLENKPVEEFAPPSRFHVIVANPPYIDKDDVEVDSKVKAFEPHEALFAADHGMSAISSWLNFVVDSLEPGGVSYFEIGYKQGEAAKDLFRNKNCFQSVDLIQDFNQRDRIIKAVKYG